MATVMQERSRRQKPAQTLTGQDRAAVIEMALAIELPEFFDPRHKERPAESMGWLPGVDLLTSSPTVTKTPTNWTTYVENGYYGGYSIEFYDMGTSSGLAPGQSTNEFQFTSPDSPSVLRGLDPVYGYYTETYSYVYQGQAQASSSNIITSIPITVVPEPPTFLLAVLGVLIFGGRAKLLTPTGIFQKKISQATQFLKTALAG